MITPLETSDLYARPCPFCNVNNMVEVVEVVSEYSFVRCNSCGSRTGSEKNAKLALQRWNGLEVKDE